MKRIVLPPSEVENGWYPRVGPDGQMRCSCGRVLVKVDEVTWACSAGFPRYRFDTGDIVVDKFGRLMFRMKDHPDENKKGESEVQQ
jgi:hypothetical protein